MIRERKMQNHDSNLELQRNVSIKQIKARNITFRYKLTLETRFDDRKNIHSFFILKNNARDNT